MFLAFSDSYIPMWVIYASFSVFGKHSTHLIAFYYYNNRNYLLADHVPNILQKNFTYMSVFRRTYMQIRS